MNTGDCHRVKECRIGNADVWEHHPVHFKIKRKTRRRHPVRRLNTGRLNNEQRKEKVKAQRKRDTEENGNAAGEPTILWDAMKVVIRGKLKLKLHM